MTKDREIFKTFIAIANEGGQIYKIDTIEFRGFWWLVPEWLSSPSNKYEAPGRLIRPLNNPIQSASLPDCDFLVSQPIPRDALDGKEVAGYEVVGYREFLQETSEQ